MHLNDIRNGTSIGKDILEKYKAALEKNDMVSRDDLYKDWLVLKQGRTNPAKVYALSA